ncbi:MAG: hypothetical protein CMH58_02630 [Myxococcales bacterium]|nr:hypothetical protein [Myxococcales bacterium]
MKFRCEHCGAKYSISDETVRGRILKIRCRACQDIMVVRDPARSMGSMDSISAHDLRAFLSRNSPAKDEVPTPKKWYLAQSGQRFGPMGESEVAKALKEGRFLPTDHAWHAGMGDWRPVRDVPELAAFADEAGQRSRSQSQLEQMDSTDPDATAYDGPLNKPKTQSGRSEAEGRRGVDPVDGVATPQASTDQMQSSVSPFSKPPTGQDGAETGHVPIEVDEPSSNTIGEDTRMFLLASGLEQGRRRRLVILFSLLMIIFGYLGSVTMGWLSSPFGQGGMTVETVNKLGKRSFVRLLVIGKRSGEDLRARMVVGVGISERLSQEPLFEERNYQIALKAIADDLVQVRIGTANFRGCERLAAVDGGAPTVDDFDCPPGHPTFRPFSSSALATMAMNDLMKLPVVRTIQGEYGDPSQQAKVLTYRKGMSLKAEDHQDLMQFLSGEHLIAAEMDAMNAEQAAEKARRARARKRVRKSRRKRAKPADEDPAARQERELRQKAKVSDSDLKRMAVLQQALGTVRIPLAKVRLTPQPGRKSELGAEDISRVFKRGIKALNNCASRAMTRQEALHGELKLEFTVQPTGRVSSVSVLTPVYEGLPVTKCITKRAKRWRFPTFPGDPAVFVIPLKLPRR